MIVALCGGVGGSKLALGLYRVLSDDSLTVVVNTADGLDYCGLRVCPDIDTLIYSLAGLARHDVGWGLEGDTFEALTTLGHLGEDTWFQVGDRDLAMHIVRTHRLRDGATLTSVVSHIAATMGVRGTILPMSDDRISTQLSVDGAWIEFQEYFVRRRHQDHVDAIRYNGLESALPSPGVFPALQEAEALVIVNSNPVLSILPIVSMPGMREVMRDLKVPRVAVSPIVGNDAVSGPAGDLLQMHGCSKDATGVAQFYVGLIDGLVIHQDDASQAEKIEQLGLRVLCTDTIMNSLHDRERLARETLEFARSLQ